MDWVTFQCVLLLCVQWISIKNVVSLNVHVSYKSNANADLEKGLIFESANLGPGWSYFIDRSSRSKEINKLIALDATSGQVYLRWKNICQTITKSSLDIKIISRTFSHSSDSSSIANYTSTPLTVYVHDLPCNIENKTSTESHIDYIQIVLFSSYFIDMFGTSCFMKDTKLLNLKEYIPYSLRKNNFCDYEIPDFTYDKHTTSIKAKSVHCQKNSKIIIPIKLLPCKSFDETVLIKVSIHNSKAIDTGFHETKVRKEQHRLKRSSTAPQFSSDEFTVSVPENQAIGYTVTHITATDPDSGPDGKLTYRLDPLQNTLSGNMFAIDPISGIVKTTAVLDREDIPQHMFTVTATDSSILQKSTYARLIINVQDENDNAPTFDKNVYPVETYENKPASTIITLRAFDIDDGKNSDIRYGIIDPVSQSTFKIDPISCSISTMKVLDREKVSSYKLVIQATDQAPFGKQKSATATVSITVLDENDNFPQFDQDSYTVNISENLDISKKPVIGHVSAVDADEGPNQLVTYSITGGNTDDTFYIDQTTGEVSVQKPIDYELHNDYSLKIRASDNGQPPKPSSTTMWVRIIDLNDNAPYFQNSIYRGTVLENEKEGVSVLTVHALDKDSGVNQLLIYSIVDADAGLPFVVNPQTGLISVRATLDREIQETYKFTVLVKDQGQPSLSATADVEITVRDINDNSPIFSQKTFPITISEDTPLYKQIIKVTASDADTGDNAVLTYLIESGNNDQVFAIGRETGTITLIKTLNYKIQSRYILTVRATDSGDKFDTAEVHINVTDINKHVPAFEDAPYQMSVDEGEEIGKSVGKVHAVDKDVGENGRITYELLNSVEFTIDHNTGVIFTREVLDRELMAGYSFDVKASDHGSPVFSDTAGVTVVVNDKNDNTPTFDSDLYKASISEAVFKGTLVTKVSAEDLDDGINSQIQYRFAGDSDGMRDFEVDGASGEIRVAKTADIDRERRSNYTLSILAVDSGVIPMTGSVSVKITIEDINDNGPQFAQDEIIALVSENKKIGSTVAVIEAVDPDEGINAVVTYKFAGGIDADKFVPNSRPGDPLIVINKVPLDYESEKKEYQILIEASSGNFFSRALLKIQVQDVNDNSPVLHDFVIIFNNYIKHFPLTPIGKIPAFDPDVSDRDKLQYNFLSGNEAGFLALNQTTGEIQLDSRLNSDVSRNGTLQVEVTDGLNKVKATCRLYVRMITEEMLGSSVTIRIDNMTTSAFLSPLFSFFVDALAIIINTDKNNIFVINVRNDTEVLGQVLNVTVSVREKTERRDRQKVDIFYSAEYLKEKIYLQRTLLANLSTLQVLPFDDNLCLQEMCPSFQICQSWLKFGEAAPFITSDTMLFRPIYPDNSFGCSCPRGFTGHSKEVFYFCDTEVDLCYSNPCNSSGTCLRKEGGYTCQCNEGFAGENCEVSQAVKYTEATCPAHVCRSPSRCVPLIEGGFRCEACPNQEDYNEFCQLTTRSFPKGSFLMFPKLSSRYRFKIQLKFATQERNGLLFYNGRFNELHDFIALELVDGQIQFSFSVGDKIEHVNPYVEGGVSDGQWHQVTVDYLNMTATVTVGEECDTEISVRYGAPIDYTCAARVKHELAPECALPSKNCQRLLDLTGPLQIGGLPTLPSSFQVQNKDYVGCMREFYIDGKLQDFNKSIANNGTGVGCENKRQFCKGAPCAHGGTCMEGWSTYRCLCPDGWGGKDCTTVTDSSRQLSGDGYLHYSNNNRLIPPVNVNWFNGLSFRTRNDTGTLMFISEQNGESVYVKLMDGFIEYTYSSGVGTQVFRFDVVKVNDGHWHDFEARWTEKDQLILILDYGQIERVYSIQSSLLQKVIKDVYVGALKITSVPADNFFTGCVKNPRVGNTQNSVLQKLNNYNAPVGCQSPDLCANSPCASRAECVNEWEGYTCKCPPGTLGPNCDNICTTYNPCQNMATCRHKPGSSYTCECGQLQSGQYCEVVAMQPCPAKWWGYPVCGPCPEDCSTENGFDPNCDNLSGKCSCLANHYQPVGSKKCLPCQCYNHGSRNLQCDLVTGQCPCVEGVVGRRCNQCPSKYAEIRMDEETGEYGCKVDYLACPRIFSHEMWWETKMLNVMVRQDCPNRAHGEVRRNCSHDGLWQEPDFFNCTNVAFLDHLSQVELMESGALKINILVAKSTMKDLAESTSTTETLYGNDLNITLRIMRLMLDYENQLLNLSDPQSVLDLTSERDSMYLSNMITVLSDIFHPKYKKEWTKLNMEGEGTQGLILRLEYYLSTLLSALELTAAQTPAPYSIVTDNIVLAVDTINKQNFSGKTIPKYDNVVKMPTFDDDTNIYLPQAAITQAPYRDFLQPGIQAPPKAYVGYVLYRFLGEILPPSYGSGVRVIPNRPMSVNSPVFSVIVRDEGKEVTTALSEPVLLTFKQLHTANRASPQCVFWRNTSRWSTGGCTEVGRYTLNDDLYVKCSCNHLTSFAILMDVADKEYVQPEPIPLQAITYVGLIICMGCLVLSFIIFFCFKRLQSNTTSIHTNLVFVLYVCMLTFLVGINKVDKELSCRLVAIILHYFYMAGFSWLCVDILHIYRMLTEVRNIDQGSMKFYYLLAYVVPGIIVSLAVGLNTEGYGTKDFCWLSMSNKFIWSFAGPITVAVIINVFMFVLAVKASCREKIGVSDLTPLRFGMFANIIILMLWGIIWVVGLLAVNFNYVGLHYFFSILCPALGVFIFIIYILANSLVRLELKKLWYRVRGRKLDLDDNIGGTRSSVYSRSALAYRNDSCDGGLARINVGISTTSTTSRSTSKSSGGPYKGEDYLRSTSTSTSGNMPAVKYPKNGLPPSYGYDPEKSDNLDPDSIQIRPKHDGNDSDSDSEMSERVSLDLASSHSSDDDDDIDVNLDWEKQLPKNKKVDYQQFLYYMGQLVRKEEAKEQARLQQKEDQSPGLPQQQGRPSPSPQLPVSQHQYQNPFDQIYSGPQSTYSPQMNHNTAHWPGDPQLGAPMATENEYMAIDRPILSSVQPDVTLQTPEYKGREFMVAPPRRQDSLLNESSSSGTHKGSLPSPYSSPQLKHSPRRVPGSPVQRIGSPLGSPRDHMTVKVLTHRGSVSTDSECSHETCV